MEGVEEEDESWDFKGATSGGGPIGVHGERGDSSTPYPGLPAKNWESVDN